MARKETDEKPEYNLTDLYEREIMPAVKALTARCEELGIPSIFAFATYCEDGAVGTQVATSTRHGIIPARFGDALEALGFDLGG